MTIKLVSQHLYVETNKLIICVSDVLDRDFEETFDIKDSATITLYVQMRLSESSKHIMISALHNLS